MKKYLLAVILVLLVGLFVRLYPALITGLPFSTDGWGSIHNAEQLLSFSPVSLSDNSVFDGYNNYWPGCSLFGAVFSHVTGLSVIDAMAFAVPLAGALSILLVFVVAKRVTKSMEIALIATILLATAYPYSLFMSGVTKETFANPIYISLILLFLLAPSWKRTLLFPVACVALVLSHHFTALIGFSVLTFLTIALLISKDKFLSSTKSNVGLLAVFAGIIGGYFGLFAYQGLQVSLSLSDLLSIGAYQLVLFAVTLFFVHRAASHPSFKSLFVRYLAFLVLVCLAFFFLTKKALVAGAPILPLHYALYLVPFAIALPLLAFGFQGLHERKSSLLIAVFLLLPLIGLECFAVFGGFSLGLTLVYRAFNFLLLPLLILVSVVFFQLYVKSKSLRGGKVLAVTVIGVILVVASMNSYNVIASVSTNESYLGYFWLYRLPEMSASQWIDSNGGNQTVAGDMKVSYLLQNYYNCRVDVPSGFKYLYQDGPTPPLLFVYPEMLTNGYVLYSGNVFALPQNWSTKLSNLNCIYSNGMVTLYSD